MQQIQPTNQVRALGGDTSGVSFFASQVVSLLADRSSKSVVEPRETLVAGLIAASLSGTKSAFAELLTEVKRARISLAALADVYIPIAARRMGQAWHDDEMSWLDVSIGVGRMQSLLREIGTAWVADQAGDAGHGTVMLIVPDREQHTLGPMVATGQMRRYGVSVCLRIAPSFNELRSLMAARHFDGVMISVATKEKLESVAKTVHAQGLISPRMTLALRWRSWALSSTPFAC
jgi:MerR family transcriptional regulator, light-induced transcriptional regulator